MIKYDEIVKQQARFMRGFWIFSGVGIGILSIGSFVYWVIDLPNNLKGVAG